MQTQDGQLQYMQLQSVQCNLCNSHAGDCNLYDMHIYTMQSMSYHPALLQSTLFATSALAHGQNGGAHILLRTVLCMYVLEHSKFCQCSLGQYSPQLSWLKGLIVQLHTLGVRQHTRQHAE